MTARRDRASRCPWTSSARRLSALLDDPTRGGMPGGAVTFAAMASLRNLPYRFVCAIGLNDGAFPSTPRPDEFDLMARDPRRGDRQRRIDERNVFLDLLLAARERLYLSYTGTQRARQLAAAAVGPGRGAARLLRRGHRRGAVLAGLAAARAASGSPSSTRCSRSRIDYFEPDADPRRRSFNDEYCEALKQRLAAPSAPAPAPRPVAAAAGDADADGDDDDDEDDDRRGSRSGAFFAAPLARAGPEFHEVTLDNLARFFRNPCRYLLQERLGIVLPEGDEELQDDEPFVPDWPARDALARRACCRACSPARRSPSCARFARAGIEYPAGRLGEHRAGAGAAAARPLRARARAGARRADARPGRRDARIRARRRAVAPDRRLRRLAPDRARSATATTTRAPAITSNGWLEHLFLNAMAPPEVAPRTTWHSRDGSYVLPPVAGRARAARRAARPLPRRAAPAAPFLPEVRVELHDNEGKRIAEAIGAWRSSQVQRLRRRPRPGLPPGAARRATSRSTPSSSRCATAVFAPLLAIIEDDRLEADGMTRRRPNSTSSTAASTAST